MSEHDTIVCDTHGTAKQTYVCQHVASGLINHQRVGFFWSTYSPDNPHPDAWCYECEARVRKTGGEWEGEALEHLQPKIMCHNCYEVAKIYHMGGNPWS